MRVTDRIVDMKKIGNSYNKGGSVIGRRKGRAMARGGTIFRGKRRTRN